VRVPEQTQQLSAEIVVKPSEVELRAWQAHVMKHPFGLGAILNGYRMRGRRHWNHEGWDSLPRPVITETIRVRLTRAIRALEDGGRQCAIDLLAELETKVPSGHGDTPCYECPPMLAQRCNAQTLEVGRRYAAYINDTFDELENCVAVNRQELAAAVTPALWTNDLASVATVGTLPKGPYGLRINRPDGGRIEAREEGPAFTWRTAYRKRVPGLADRRAHLLDHVTSVDSEDALSGMALVPRPWWERVHA